MATEEAILSFLYYIIQIYLDTIALFLENWLYIGFSWVINYYTKYLYNRTSMVRYLASVIIQCIMNKIILAPLATMVQMEGMYQVDSKYCTHCGSNNAPSAKKCHKCLALLAMVMPGFDNVQIFVQFIATGAECITCRIMGKRFWYNLVLKDTLDVAMRLCPECLSNLVCELPV